MCVLCLLSCFEPVMSCSCTRTIYILFKYIMLVHFICLHPIDQSILFRLIFMYVTNNAKCACDSCDFLIILYMYNIVCLHFVCLNIHIRLKLVEKCVYLCERVCWHLLQCECNQREDGKYVHGITKMYFISILMLFARNFNENWIFNSYICICISIT